MWYEMAAVAGDRRHILADADPRRLVADDPRTYNCIAVTEARKRCIGLVDPALVAVTPALAQHLGPAIHGDVRALARIQRLLHIVAGNPKSLERRRKQV